MLHSNVREAVIDIIDTPYLFPDDIMEVIKNDNIAWKNFIDLPEAYKRIRIAYIDAARKRPDEFKKRLDFFLRKTRENKLITGFGGIGKYYNNIYLKI